MTVKRMATRLVALGLLEWTDLLEDGNLFWEIAFCEKAIWPEPDRWHATICNFLQLMACAEIAARLCGDHARRCHRRS